MRFGAARFVSSIFADGIPVLANDFSQSCEEQRHGQLFPNAELPLRLRAKKGSNSTSVECTFLPSG
jgi:hypothetical protein